MTRRLDPLAELGDPAVNAIDRELAGVREIAGAPRDVRLGCSTVAHDSLGFCAACAPFSQAVSANLELSGWRLLALRAAAIAVAREP